MTARRRRGNAPSADTAGRAIRPERLVPRETEPAHKGDRERVHIACPGAEVRSTSPLTAPGCGKARRFDAGLPLLEQADSVPTSHDKTLTVRDAVNWTPEEVEKERSGISWTSSGSLRRGNGSYGNWRITRRVCRRPDITPLAYIGIDSAIE